MSYNIINPRNFSFVTNRMRNFFINKGFVEVHPQSALSILAACEDPTTISTYNYDNKVWPLPQTGQMWLEHVLLKNKDINGCFCVSTSYRNEQNPVPGRHEKIFPMFEFESKGDFNDLINLEKDLLSYLGFNKRSKKKLNKKKSSEEKSNFVDDSNFQYSTRWHNSLDFIPGNEVEYFNTTEAINVEKIMDQLDYPEDDYLSIANDFEVKELENEHEKTLCDIHGPVYFIKNFPLYTSPFWNMKYDKETGISKKVDVILDGMETIGSAERSCNPEEMRELYYSISEGKYSKLLHDTFTEKRVVDELEDFLKLDFFPRYGGGIGITRMISAMENNNLINTV